MIIISKKALSEDVPILGGDGDKKVSLQNKMADSAVLKILQMPFFLNLTTVNR